VKCVKKCKRQVQILEYIEAHIKEHGYSPSVREIGEAVGLASSSTVQGHLDRLEKQGKIARVKILPRTIRVLETMNTE